MPQSEWIPCGDMFEFENDENIYFVQLPEDDMQKAAFPVVFGYGTDAVKPVKRQGDEIVPPFSGISDANNVALGPPPYKRPATAEKVAAHLRNVETFEEIEQRLQLSDEEDACNLENSGQMPTNSESTLSNVPEITVKPEYQDLLRRQADSFGPFIRQPSESLALVPYIPPDELLRTTSDPNTSTYVPPESDQSASSSCHGSSSDFASSSDGDIRNLRDNSSRKSARPFAKANRRVKFTVCTGNDCEDQKSSEFLAPPTGPVGATSQLGPTSQFSKSPMNQSSNRKQPSPRPIISFPSDESSLDRVNSNEGDFEFGSNDLDTPRIQEVFDTKAVTPCGSVEDMEL